MRQPSASIVITTHNRLALLKEAVESVRAQTSDDWELLVVDDASEDDTWEWLAGQRDGRVRAFRLGERAERSAARNHGLAEAAGEFVMFLDDDDRLRRDALARLADPLRAHAEAVAAVGAKWRFEEWGRGVRIHHSFKLTKRVVWPELLFGWSAVSGQTLFRAERVRRAGGYRSTFIPAEDRDLWLRVARLGPVLLEPSVVLEYRVHGGQWRPGDILELRERTFKDFIDALPPAERARAERIRESARWSQRADSAFAEADYGGALAGYLRACYAAPSLCLSPLVGPPVRWNAKKSLLRLLFRGRR